MRVRDGRAVPNFIGQALRGEDVTVYGDGSQTRSLCYVSDLVDGVIRLMLSKSNEPINIGNPQELTIEEIAGPSCASPGRRAGSLHRALPVDDPKVRKPDITRATTMLDWGPKVSLEAGLSTTIEYFRAKLAAR